MNKIEFNMSIDPEGSHEESRWGEEFPKAVKWLFFEKMNFFKEIRAAL
ncbi:MAG: hypothetical protein R2788_22410 [Saprospiraceae bacterium]